MSPFSSALEYVHTTLSELHARGAALTASLDSLARLSVLAEAPEMHASDKSDKSDKSDTVVEPAPAVSFRRTAAAPAPAARPPMAAVPVLPNLPPVLPRVPGSKAERLAALREPVLACVKCEHLARRRTQVVFGVGNPEAELMFVGEAPGED